MESIYHANPEKCVCNGTGLIDLGDGKNQAYCPIHKIQRKWPQQQADNSIKFIDILC